MGCGPGARRCEWSEGVAGGKLKYEIGLRHICKVKRSKRNRPSAEGNKTIPVEARSDQQASQTPQRVDFKLLHKGTTACA